MNDKIQHLNFGSMSESVKLVGCEDLLQHLPQIFPGWTIQQVASTEQSPVISVSRDENSFIIDGYWLEKPVRCSDKVEAICTLVAELIRAFVQEDDQLLCLHGAAAEFAGQLVIFPSKYRAGKSILSACLASSGIPLCCDDVLPISLAEGQGVAPGLAPRLRLPLPDNLSPKSRKFIDSHAGLMNERYLYLDLEHDGLVARGQQLPIGAFVLLEREEGATAAFEEISESEVLQRVVWQNFAREAEAPRILEVLGQLVADAKLYCLRYDRAEDAVELLASEFNSWAPRQKRQTRKMKLSGQQVESKIHLFPGCYMCKADLNVVQVDDQNFLADRHGDTIHHLNPTATAIWSLLADPVTLVEMADILTVAFPELERDQVEADVSSLIADLKEKNLLLCGAQQ